MRCIISRYRAIFLKKSRLTYSVSGTPSKVKPIEIEGIDGYAYYGTNAKALDEMPWLTSKALAYAPFLENLL